MLAPTDGQWHWLEVRNKVGNGTDGRTEAYLDGELLLSNIGYDSNAGRTNSAQSMMVIDPMSSLGSGDTDNSIYIGPMIIYSDDDPTGLVPATDFPIGPVYIEKLTPNAAGTHTDFTKVGGEFNYTAATGRTGDRGYVESSTSTDRDTYGFTNTSSTGGTIYGVRINVLARNDSGGTTQLRTVNLSGTSTALGSAATPSTTYDTVETISETDPDTGSAWTTTGLDAAEFGFEIV